MNAFALFALLLCAVVAMVSGLPSASEDVAPAELNVEDLLEGAESRGYHGHGGYKYPGRGGGGYKHPGGGRGGYHYGQHGHGR